MYVILTDDGDTDGAWLVRGLAEAGLDCLAVTSADLAGGTDWRHEVSTDGAWFSVRLPDGRGLDSRELRGAVNRMHLVLPPAIAMAPETERSYAEQEFSALMLSVLACLPGTVLNPPSPQGLCGAVRHPSELTWLAGQAGLPVLPYVFDGRDLSDPTAGWAPAVPHGTPVTTIYVVAGEVVGEVAPGLRHGCVALSRVLGQPLLGIDLLAVADGRAVCVGATPCPALAPGGEALIAAIARALRTGEEEDR